MQGHGCLVTQAKRFDDVVTPRPVPSGLDVRCSLGHFSIVAYAVPVARLGSILPQRFAPQTILLHGQEMVLLSVVSFLNTDFASAVLPGPRFTMAQSDYRIYIVDRETSARCVWFLGSTLDSWARIVPRYLWRMPWYRGQLSFDCEVNEDTGLYARYVMQCRSAWSDASLQLHQSGTEALELPGFPDTETGLVHLTHPMTGYYHRLAGKLASYSVWHQPLQARPATLDAAEFSRLDSLGLVPLAEQQHPYAVMVQPLSTFFVYLPPRVVR